MKPRHNATLAENERQYDAIVDVLENACIQVERRLGADAVSAFPHLKLGLKARRPEGAHRFYAGLYDLLEQARKERSQLKPKLRDSKTQISPPKGKSRK